jgi:hypothetical protein
MSESTPSRLPANDIDIGALAELPAEPRLRHLAKALANLPGPLDDLCNYDHPLSDALRHYQKAYSERWSWLPLAIGVAIFWPQVSVPILLALAFAVYGFAQANLSQRMVMLLWIALPAVTRALQNRRKRRRVATQQTNRFGGKAAPLDTFVTTLEDTDAVIRGPGFVWMHCATRDRLVRISEWLNAWADEAERTDLAAAHAAARHAVHSALERTEAQLHDVINQKVRGAFPIQIAGLPEVDAALSTLELAMQRSAPIWPTPPIRVSPLVPVGPTQRRARVSFDKPIIELDFAQPDLAAHMHSNDRVWRDILGARGVPADLYYEQYPSVLKQLLPFTSALTASRYAAVSMGIGLALAPWLTFVPILPWRDSSRLLLLYYPAALLLFVLVLIGMAIANHTHFRRWTTSSAQRSRERHEWTQLTGTSMVLNGEHAMVVADGFGSRLRMTSEWATQCEQRHASDPPVAKAARSLHLLIDELQDAHTPRVQDAINTAPHGVVVIPVNAEQFDAQAGDLFSLLTVFELDTCSPPAWLTERLA